LVHPWKTRAIASARIKHDRLDSRVLAELLRTGYLAEAYIAPREVRELRQLLRHRARSVQWATRAKNGVHGVLNREGIRSPIESLFGPKGRAFLAEVELRELDRWEVDDQLERLDLLGAQIGELDREIRARVRTHPVAQALEQIPGIGPFIALLVVAEVGEIERFPGPKQMVSYTGLAPSLYASGEHRWGGPITKQGSSLLRWALVQAAHVASRSPQFASFHQRQRERHGAARAAIALARKLATRIYFRWRGVVAHNSPASASGSGAHLGWRMVGPSTLPV
jgi:transposase